MADTNCIDLSLVSRFSIIRFQIKISIKAKTLSDFFLFIRTLINIQSYPVFIQIEGRKYTVKLMKIDTNLFKYHNYLKNKKDRNYIKQVVQFFFKCESIYKWDYIEHKFGRNF